MKNKNYSSKLFLYTLSNFRLIGFIIISGILSTGCSGPKTLPLVKGDELRVTSSDHNLRNTELVLDEIQAEDIVLKNMMLEGEPSFGIPLSSLNKLQVKRGKKNHLLTGLGVGTLVGGIGGAALAPDCSGEFFCELDQAAAVFTGMLLGSITGTLIGAIAKSDRWKNVQRNQLRLTSMPNSNGAIGIGLTIPF